MGCATPEGATGGNIARQIALRAGLPVTASGVTVNRFCSSRPADDRAWPRSASSPARATSIVAGGVESISCVQNEVNQHMLRRPWLMRAQARDLLDDAADRRAGRQALQHRARAQDEYGARSQQSAAAAQAAGKFKDEIAPITVTPASPTRRPGAAHARK